MPWSNFIFSQFESMECLKSYESIIKSYNDRKKHIFCGILFYLWEMCILLVVPAFYSS